MHTSFKIDLFAHDRDLILSKSRYSTTSASLVHSSRSLARATDTGSREGVDFFDLDFFLSFASVVVDLVVEAACTDVDVDDVDDVDIEDNGAGATTDDDDDDDDDGDAAATDDDDSDDDVFLLVNILNI